MTEFEKMLQRADNGLDAALYVLGMLMEDEPLTDRQHELLNVLEVAVTRAQEQLRAAQSALVRVDDARLEVQS